MRIRTATDLGAFIRERRTQLGMDQRELAEKAGTSRKWVIEVEKGKPGAEIGLILRTLKTLSVTLNITTEDRQPKTSGAQPRTPDITKILESMKKRP